MLDIKLIRQNPEKIKAGCLKKQAEADVDRLLIVDKERRSCLQETERFRAEENRLSSLIGSETDFAKKNELIEAGRKTKADMKNCENRLKELNEEFVELMREIPNLPLDSVPSGKDENDNVVLREAGEKPKFDFRPKDYLEIAERLDLIDVKRAAKVAGTRFGYLKGAAALLELSLVNLALDVLIKEKFIPIIPPVMLKPEIMEGMGYIDSCARAKGDKKYKGEEVYFLRDDDLVLVGTSEQSIGPMHGGEVLNEKDLPKRYVGISTCFRREAGAYGKDTRGILRVHQFNKIEMFSFCRPQDSEKEHQFFLEMEESLMRLLEVPYRVVQLCAGDLSVPSAATYDIEAWMPGQNQYRETHSTSNCTDFQARRLNIRYRGIGNGQAKKIEFVHTLNGTAFATGRTLIAIIENYQQEDGSIAVPKALQKYIGLKKIV